MSNMMAGRQSFLIVFDFDDTIVDSNSDEAIPHYLGRTDFMKSFIKANESMQWTDIMDAVMAPFTAEQITNAAGKSVAMDEKMPDVFRYLVEQRDACPPLVEIAIASDANLHFIESCIAAHIPFARASISQIHSNSFHTVSEDASNTSAEQRRCRVGWYEPKSHDCPCCQSQGKRNMCKSRIISRLLHTTQLVDPTVIFVGDGSNDFCPVVNILRPRDFMFLRAGFPIHSITANSDRCGPGGCCHMDLWTNATNLLQCFQRAMDPARRLPTIARFRDAGANEFRFISLSQRMPAILQRTLKDNEATIAPAGQKLLTALIDAVRSNGFVAGLPGADENVPAWLAAYARAPEFDTLPNNAHADNSAAPRWGQLPWLHGEVYFYHLVAQYLLLAESDAQRAESAELIENLVTPYASSMPVSTRDCNVAREMDLTPALRGAAPQQGFDASFISRDKPEDVADGVALADKRSYARDVAYPSVLVPQNFFQPYRDFFILEKNKVLHQFLKVKICPMLACQPWLADESFVDTMLRWMLWGNGIDLSMFTLEQLQSSHVTAGGSDDKSDNEKELMAMRTSEGELVRAQDAHVLGNDVTAIANLVRHIIHTEPTQEPRTINIVMDNVGVECVADLIFSLWLLNHHPSLRVILHVKCMAYYVSDVTPPDFDVLLHELECASIRERTLSPVLLPFTRQLREAFGSGRLRVDADAVWTQPCEYRELPPRVINTFFYTQRVRRQSEWPKAAAGVDARLFTARSALVIFKGDLNFRRLIGDRHWDARAFLSTLSPEERRGAAVAHALRDTAPAKEREAPTFSEIVADFWPVAHVPVCAVRTIKSESCIGIAADTQDELDRTSSTWRSSGKYGVILLAAGNKM